MQRVRRPESFPKCQCCSYFKYCRGCAAASTEAPTADPICFATHRAKSANGSPSFAPVTPGAGPEEELQLIAAHFANVFTHELSERLARPGIGRELFCLAQSSEYRGRFFATARRGGNGGHWNGGSGLLPVLPRALPSRARDLPGALERSVAEL